jgi:GMP synthase (glutamine-hydrolysing)
MTNAAPKTTANIQRHDRILILDFGSQVTQLIARRLRENGVYCEVWPFNQAPEERVKGFAPKGIILSGGPASVTKSDSPRAPEYLYELGLPLLGICYGQQTMVQQLGGKVEGSDHQEFGRAYVKVQKPCAIFEGVWSPGASEQVWMSHGDRVTKLPSGFEVVGTSEGAPYAAVADDKRHFYGVQFHPEVMHTPHGTQLLKNFTHLVCGCSGDWTMAAFREEAVAKIRKQVGKGRVICGLSGGVDSSVTAVLLHEAIGDQLTCIYVDTGLMRANESKQVVDMFRGSYNIPLIHEDASERFLSGLEGISDPR